MMGLVQTRILLVLAALALSDLGGLTLTAQQSGSLRKIVDAPPLYPDRARQARIEGAVVLQITVGADGRVSDGRVIQSVPLLDQAALTAARQWVYDRGGQSAPVSMTVRVPFSLASPGPTLVEEVEPLRGQHNVALRVTMASDVEAVISPATFETAVAAQLRQAGLTVSKWAKPQTREPVLNIYITGQRTSAAPYRLIYRSFVDYYAVLEIPFTNPARATKGRIYDGGRLGIAPVSEAAAELSASIRQSVDLFLKNAYVKANPGPQPTPAPVASAAPFAPVPSEVPLTAAANEEMQGYPAGSAEVDLRVESVGIDGPPTVAESELRAAAEKALNRRGIRVTGVGPSLTKPLITLQVEGANSPGRVVFSTRARYARYLRMSPAAGRERLVLADLQVTEGVGMGPPDFALRDILSSIDLRIGEVVQAHLEANKTR